jgi:predicted permease
MRFIHQIGGFCRDIRYACRGFLKAPGFTSAAIVTLALGIGANTAIFSVVNATLLEPLPFANPDRLVFVWSDMTSAGYPRGPLSGPELDDLRRRSSQFDGFAAIWATTTTLTGDGDPQMLRIGLVTDNFFPLLGAQPAMGRTFAPEDDSSGAPTAILLSAGLWERRFGADPAVVGRRILINGQPTTVVGVMPAAFRTYLPPDAGVPDDLEAWQLFNRHVVRAPRGQMFLRVVGRLRSDASFDAARTEVTSIAAQISREFTDYGRAGRAFALVELQSDGVRMARPVLLALFGGVFTLLLVAVVNVAGLLVARAAARARESAVQIALGATRGRLFSQCLAEGALLALAGGIAGIATALAGVRLLVATRPAALGRIDNTTLDVRVLAVTAGTAIAVALLFSLAPMAEMLRVRVIASLQQGARGAGGHAHRRLRSMLVVVQIALAVVLLVSAALFVRTFRALQAIDPGFRADGVLSFRVGLPPNRYGNQEVFNTFSRQYQSKLAALPGITHAGAISHLPYDNVPNWSTNYVTERGQDDSQARRADARAVTPGFFDAAGARLVAGRDFTEQDDPHGPPVAIVDDTFARRVWPTGEAIGQEMAVDPRVTGHPTVWVTIVGVVGHIRHLSLTEEVREQVYFPVRQVPRNPMAYVVRTTADAASLTTLVRATLNELDPQVPIYDVRPLGDSVANAMATQRFTMRLVSLFAVVALGMACVGVYGVMAYAVSKRRVEFGVRLALGARPRSVVSLVVREGAGLALAGLVIGAMAAFNVTRMVESQLYGVTPRDVVSYLAAVPVLALAAVLACWLPARRATRANPIDALRAE